MANNIINFPTRKVEEELDPVHEFINSKLMDWAIENGIDTSTRKFKYSAAGIMTCMQGMLLEV